jgi:glutamate racemase
MIGIFDSGIGGLSVFRELTRLLPAERYVYFSDSRNCPYGPKEAPFIKERSSQITDFLIEKGAELIVVACNTATAAAIKHLRENYRLPFVGMEPAIKPAILRSESGVVGVLATAGTLKGALYLNTLATFKGNVKVIERIGEGLVEAVERADFDSPEVEALLRGYIEPMLEEGADHIVLGCTHYPFLQDTIKKIVDGRAKIVNPAPAVARQADRLYAKKAHHDDTPFCSFYSSAVFTEPVKQLARSLTKSPCEFFDETL